MNNIDPDKLKIVLYPHPTLLEVAKPITEINDEVREVAKKMIELMHDAPGVGLAAPQVGLDMRMFVVNSTGIEGEDYVFINPILSEPSEEKDAYEEGCLSLPDIIVTIKRPTGISIEAQDLEGNIFRMSSYDMAAKVWQHENDHLDGKLIIDKMGMADKIANRRAIKNLLGK